MEKQEWLNTFSELRMVVFIVVIFDQLTIQFSLIIIIFWFGGIKWPLFYTQHFTVLIELNLHSTLLVIGVLDFIDHYTQIHFSMQPYFMVYCLESLFRNLSPIENSIGDGEIWIPDLLSTILTCYQLSCPDWIATKLVCNFVLRCTNLWTIGHCYLTKLSLLNES